jgi:hypothetical protein
MSKVPIRGSASSMYSDSNDDMLVDTADSDSSKDHHDAAAGVDGNGEVRSFIHTSLHFT